MHRIFFEKIAHKKVYIDNVCNDRFKAFDNVCWERYLFDISRLKNFESTPWE